MHLFASQILSNTSLVQGCVHVLFIGPDMLDLNRGNQTSCGGRDIFPIDRYSRTSCSMPDYGIIVGIMTYIFTNICNCVIRCDARYMSLHMRKSLSGIGTDAQPQHELDSG